MAKESKDRRQMSKNEGFAWFPFDVVDWTTSRDVQRMSTSQEGCYIRLLAIQWRDNGLPMDRKILEKTSRILPETLENFLRKFPETFKEYPEKPGCFLNAKLWNLAVEVGKVKGRKIVEEKRGEGDSESEKSFIPPRKGSAAIQTSKPGDMVTITVGGVGTQVKRLRHSGCCDLCDVRWPGDPDPHCAKCEGRGSYTEPGRGVEPCVCGMEG
jgi:hypothetical protein